MTRLHTWIWTLILLALCAGASRADERAWRELAARRMEFFHQLSAQEGFNRARLEDLEFNCATLARVGPGGDELLLVAIECGDSGRARKGIGQAIDCFGRGFDTRPTIKRLNLSGAEDATLMRGVALGKDCALVSFRVGSALASVALAGHPQPKQLKRITRQVVAGLSRPELRSLPAAPGSGAAPRRGRKSGTGFYVSETLVLTNAHVVGEAKQARLVLHSGRSATGRVLARGDAGTEFDLALVETRTRGRPLRLATSRNLQRVYVYGYGSMGGAWTPSSQPRA